MIRVLYFISTLSQADGVTSFVMNFARNLNKNFKVTILCYNIRTSKRYLDELTKKNFNVFFVKNPNDVGLKSFAEDLKNFFKSNNNFDIFHCNTTSSGAFALYFAKKAGIKIRILHAHATKNGETSFKNIRNLFLSYIAKRYATNFMACSIAAGNYLFKKRKFIVIHNAIDYSRFIYNKSYDDYFRDLYSIPSDTKIIGFVGRFELQKNPLFLIDVFDKLRERNVKAQLFILGEGSLREELEKRIQISKYKSYIHLIGEVSNVQMRYSFFNILLMPSIYEGLPLVGVEAQTAGCQVICSSTITTELKICDNIHFVELNDLHKWVELISNSSKKRNNIDLCTTYDINHEVLKIQNIYEELVYGKNSSSNIGS